MTEENGPVKGEKVAYRAINNEIYAAYLIQTMGIEHHPRKAYLFVLCPEELVITVADYDPDLIEPHRYTDIGVESWLIE